MQNYIFEEEFKKLSRYTSCDISDALMKLNVPGAGFLGDLVLRTPNPLTVPLISYASTVLFLPKSSSASSPHPSNIPTAHFADSLANSASTILLISQPPSQPNAVLGGLVALRLTKLGVKSILVDGRVRDLSELSNLNIPILSTGVSTVGAGALSKAHRVNGEEGITIHATGTVVKAGDIIFISKDPVEGCVAIPRELLGRVMELLPELAKQDELVKMDVEGGMELGVSMRLRREIGARSLGNGEEEKEEEGKR